MVAALILPKISPSLIFGSATHSVANNGSEVGPWKTILLPYDSHTFCCFVYSFSIIDEHIFSTNCKRQLLNILRWLTSLFFYDHSSVFSSMLLTADRQYLPKQLRVLTFYLGYSEIPQFFITIKIIHCDIECNKNNFVANQIIQEQAVAGTGNT